MASNEIAILTHVYDQVDLLKHFFRWHTELGVDAFLVQDMGSTDGTLELLQELAQEYPIEWFSLVQMNLREHRFGNTGDEMALLARSKLDPKWLMMCDVDEFLVLEHGNLRIALERAEARGITSINIPCFNMTGRSLPVGGDAVASLSLRIVEPYVETLDQQISGVLPRPYIFIRHRHKTIVLASAFSGYVAGSHGAAVSFGETGQIDGAKFNHYSIRGFDKFQQKIRNVEAFLKTNDHLPSWWGWHWRRWIKLDRSGQLRADYDAQFVSEDQERELIESGVCVLDRRVADWANDAGVDPPFDRPVPSQPTAAAHADGEVVFQDWFISDGGFESPEWIDRSGWSEFWPFVSWLVRALQPRLILDIGAEDGSSCLAFCQALDHSAADGRCVSVRSHCAANSTQAREPSIEDAQLHHLTVRYRHNLTIVNGSIDDGLSEIRDRSLDLVSIDGSRIAELDGGTLDRLIGIMSDRGVVLVHGLEPGPHDSSIAAFWGKLSQGRPRFDLYHGNGLGVVAVGTQLPSDVARIFTLSSPGARTFRNIYARLAAAIPKHISRTLVGSLRQQIDGLAQERDAFKGGCEERDATIMDLQRVTAERDSVILGLRTENQRQRERVASLENTVGELQKMVTELHRRSLRGRVKALLVRLHLM